jgi:CRISPR-associated protein Cpf1
LAIEYNAFIVLENLNTGFKRWRQKIEKQVYQKLELALAKKLNFVVDKNAKDWEFMSVQNALQLTPPVNNFWDIENSKQYWIMLYTRANYTSQTDPKTGWRKSIYLKKWSEGNINNQICENFDDFGFEGKDYYFTYTDKNTWKKWTLYSWINGKSLDRYRGKLNNNTNIWEILPVNIVEILDWVFESFDKIKSFKMQILQEWKELKKVWEFTAWESLRYTIDMIQQIRNSWPKDKDWNPTCDDDFILSPVRENWKNFDSREFLAQDLPEMPNSWDSNWAYNIARKWIIQFEHIKRNLEQYISDNEYDNFLAWKDKWEKYLENHKKDLTKKK